MQPWQGIDVALEAFTLLADHRDLALVVCASTRPGSTKVHRRRASRLGIAERVHWVHRLDKTTLASWIAHAEISLAPLTECARNLDQGCCPLKILESMAAGIPVIASDLPAVREIVSHGDDGWLVRANRPAHLARAIRVLLEHPEQARAIGAAGRRTVAARFSWRLARERHQALCRSLVAGDPAPPRRAQPATPAVDVVS